MAQRPIATGCRYGQGVAAQTQQGVDPAVLGRYLTCALADSRWEHCELTVMPGGKSNLTYLLTCAGGRLVLRRPPLRQALPTAHDMAREHTVISALAGTDVPVPRALHLCTDPDVIGAPFHLMSYVDGPVARSGLPAGYADRPDQRRAVAEELVHVLARLHAVDVDTVGLRDFGRPDGFLARQVRRWVRQWRASRPAESSALDTLAGALAADVPASPEPTIVHGDYRLDNAVLHPQQVGRIAAVLDWEMSTIGDPLTDLGLLLVYWQEARDPPESRAAWAVPTATSLAGFPSRAEVAALYARLTGRDLSALNWYVAFGCFKLAVVIAGIVARHRAGAMVGEGVDGMGAALEPLLQRGTAALGSAP